MTVLLQESPAVNVHNRHLHLYINPNKQPGNAIIVLNIVQRVGKLSFSASIVLIPCAAVNLSICFSASMNVVDPHLPVQRRKTFIIISTMRSYILLHQKFDRGCPRIISVLNSPELATPAERGTATASRYRHAR